VFHHVTIAVSDRDASERFYDLVLATLGVHKDRSAEGYAEWGSFRVARAEKDDSVTRRLHIGFTAPSREHVDAFWRAGTEAGYRDDGAPGPRPQYGEDYYGGFLLDPDGNSAEAAHHGSMPGGRPVDHLWIRVSDLQGSRRFYETIAGDAELAVSEVTPERVSVRGRHSTMSLLSGEPTTGVHLAFPAEADVQLLDPDGNEVELVRHPRPVS
jgi:catechol 2,3-dioxygenase-like lactoylglutathione lyase family enzyme